MLGDRGKFYLTLTLVAGLLVIIAVSTAVGADSTPAYALLTFVAGYVFANGKQLVAPFTPTAMIVPKPEQAAELIRKQAAELERQQQVAGSAELEA